MPTGNIGKVYVTGNSVNSAYNSGSLTVVGDTAQVTNNYGVVSVTGINARITDNQAAGKVLVSGNSATISNNAGDVYVTGNATDVTGTNTGQIEIANPTAGGTATVATNSGTLSAASDGVALTTNSSGALARIIGAGAGVTTNNGSLSIQGNGAQVTTNNSLVDIVGNNSTITTNNGSAELTGVSNTVANNAGSGTALLGGTSGTVTTNFGTATFTTNTSATVTTNYSGGFVRFDGSGTASVGNNYFGGTVYIAATITTATITTNYGTLETHSASVTISNNAGSGTLLIADATVGATVNTNAGTIDVASSTTGTFTVTNGSGTVTTAAANTVINGNGSTSTIVATQGTVTINNTGSGVIDLKPAVSVSPQFTGTINGTIKTEGGTAPAVSNKMSTSAARFSISASGTLELFTGAQEFVNLNSGYIRADASIIDVDTNGSGGVMYVFNASTATVSTNSGQINVFNNNSAATITSSTGAVYVDDHASITITTSTGHVELNRNSTGTIIINGGTLESYSSSSTITTNTGDVFLFDSSSTITTNQGRVEIEADSTANITNNEGYVRNFNTTIPAAVIITNNLSTGVVDNYGVINANCNNAVTDNLRQHVTDELDSSGIPTGNVGIDTTGAVSGTTGIVQPIVTGGVLSKDPQYLDVFVNGEWRTLVAYWEEVPSDACCIDGLGMPTGDGCNYRTFQLRFSGEADGGRITFDSNDAYEVEGTRYTIDCRDDDHAYPYPDVPYDTSPAVGLSGFTLVYEVHAEMFPVYTTQPGLWIQTGANSNQGIEVYTGDIHANMLGSDTMQYNTKDLENPTDVSCPVFELCDCSTIATSRITTWEHAQRAIQICDGANMKVADIRALIGAQQNRIEAHARSNAVSSENLNASESRIRDTDMARELMNNTKASVLAQATMSLMAQANQYPQAVLQLIK